jgi:glycosyltransferase involved in cell wall biosynthesis
MNKGIKLSNGDIIATLNADDVYADETIVGRMVEFMQSNGLEAAYGDLVYVDRNNSDCVIRFWRAGGYKKGAFCHGWVVPHPTFFCRKGNFEKYGYFNEKFHIAADFELMLRFIEKRQIKVGYLPKVIVKMRIGGKANILQGMIRGNWEIIKSFRLNGLRLSPWFFILKPITKISQLFTRPNKGDNRNIDL